MAKVLISDKMSPRAAELLRERGVEAVERTGLSPEEFVAAIGDFDGLAVRSATKVTAEAIDSAPNLKVIGRAGIGVDNIDVAAATQKGVVVMNTPYGNAITTAEHAIAMMMALARRIPAANASTQSGKWEKSKFMGVELTGKILGIVGCGNIGSIVADRGRALRMKVIAYDPFLSPERAADLGVERVELEALFQGADFITLHVPLTDTTRGMINAESIATMRDGVRIINCARGGLIDEGDLKAGLESGKVAGAALDVFEVEPATENVLFGMENVITTPHLGASTSEAQENVAIQVAEQIADFLLNGAIANAVNMPSLSGEEAPRLQPYMKLAELLGSFAGQITESGLRQVTIEYEGLVAGLNTRPLSAALLAGLLTPLLETVNMVSAPVFARERDIGVTEIKNERSVDYQTCIRLTVTTEKRSRSVCGTLFGQDKPRIIQVENVSIEAGLGPHMLFIRNRDKPGLVAALGGALADAGINIATFSLGRGEPGGDAMALIETDQVVPDEVLKTVAGLPNVLQAKHLKF